MRTALCLLSAVVFCGLVGLSAPPLVLYSPAVLCAHCGGIAKGFGIALVMVGCYDLAVVCWRCGTGGKDGQFYMVGMCGCKDLSYFYSQSRCGPAY